MAFISYTPNLEDVMLRRALKHVANGFYIDIGAHDPIEGSLTKAFYDLGWRGINVEPLPLCSELLRVNRPDDTNLQAAVSDEGGSITIYHSVSAGALSTTSVDVADRHRQEGLEITPLEVTARTLSDICSEHVGDKQIHFLKIDVEGAEEAVLRGMDFGRWRPWIVVVEATEPMSPVPNHEKWEYFLTGNAYEFVYFDGINRFYLAHEQLSLRHSFFAPPNVFDDFVRYSELQLRTELERVRAELQRVYSGQSWGAGRPISIFSRVLFLPKRLASRLLMKAMTFAAKHPTLKARAISRLRKFPKLDSRIRRFAFSRGMTATYTPGQPPTGPIRGPRALTPHTCDVIGSTESPGPRVGLISTWNTRCGIAAYSEHLFRDIPISLSVLAPYAAELERQDTDNVFRCWSMGESDDLIRLTECILSLSIEVLVIQFNYGFFNLGRFADFLRNQIGFGKKVIITFHSTTDPIDINPGKRLSLLAPVLSRCQRLLVHSLNDVDRLRALGLTKNVEFFPHGIPAYTPSRKERTDNTFTLATYGFFLSNKGLLEIIDTVSSLRRDGRDVRLRMVNAKYPALESENLISEARKKISKMKLAESVELLTEFLTDEESLGFLSDADLIVFPYQFSRESTSAAARYGIAAGRPVAVTPLPIFDDVKSAVFYLPGASRESMKEGIAKLISDISAQEPYIAEKMESAAVWRKSYSYTQAGARLHTIIRDFTTDGISADRK